jgi:hypothetical protein
VFLARRPQQLRHLGDVDGAPHRMIFAVATTESMALCAASASLLVSNEKLISAGRERQ